MTIAHLVQPAGDLEGHAVVIERCTETDSVVVVVNNTDHDATLPDPDVPTCTAVRLPAQVRSTTEEVNGRAEMRTPAIAGRDGRTH